MRVAKWHTSKAICKAVCLPSRRWQIQDFSAMIVDTLA
jgi:hypothetical protein